VNGRQETAPWRDTWRIDPRRHPWHNQSGGGGTRLRCSGALNRAAGRSTTRKHALWIALVALWSALAVVCQATEITSIRPVSTAVPRYGRFEVEVDISETYSNPFDPDEVDASLAVVPPSGDTLSVPAFWYQAYERSNTGTDEILTEVGDACWMARFGPSELGLHLYFIEAVDSAGYVKAGELHLSRLTCVALCATIRFVRGDVL